MHSVILLENDEVMKASMTSIVAEIDSLQLIGSGATLKAGFELLQKKPDFALVDLMLDDGVAYDFISEAVDSFSTKVLIVSVLGDEASVISAIQSGAQGYIKKDATSAELKSAINAILRGEAPMSPTIARHLLRRIKGKPGQQNPKSNPNEAACVLSPREQQILEALAFGMNYKEVARKYELSHHTVAKYIKTIYKKLSVHSRAEAVVEGVKNGLISIDEL